MISTTIKIIRHVFVVNSGMYSIESIRPLYSGLNQQFVLKYELIKMVVTLLKSIRTITCLFLTKGVAIINKFNLLF